MTSHAIADELASLPAEARREVFDFIVFLRQQHGRVRSRGSVTFQSIKNDKFLGIWADRSDMQDGARWVREVRENEWSVHDH